MVSFRPLAREDFGRLARWLAEPAVAYWWNHEWTPEALERDFGAVIDGRDPTEVHIASVEGAPLGLIQRYTFADNAEYLEELAPILDVPAGAISIDYLVGEPGRRGRGLGARMIAAYVEAAWPRYPDARDVVVPVSLGNRASWLALERAGFTRVATGELEPDNPAEPRDHVVYAKRRPALPSATNRR